MGAPSNPKDVRYVVADAVNDDSVEMRVPYVIIPSSPKYRGR